jgi:uncharacterized membrane protein (DUF373 family)
MAEANPVLAAGCSHLSTSAFVNSANFPVTGRTAAAMDQKGFWSNRIGAMEGRSEPTKAGLSKRVGALVDAFETVIYAIAFLLLVAAAVLVVIGGVDAVIEAAAHRVNTLQGGVLVLDRVLMVLIIAEIAATLRAVLLYHEIAAEPFLFIGLIACVRRVLIVTAATEQVQTDKELDRLLFELGALGLLVIGIAAAIFMIRRSGPQTTPGDREHA